MRGLPGVLRREGGLVAPWLLVLLVCSKAFAIPGNYVTNDMMSNSIFDDILQVKAVSPVVTAEDCDTLCQKHVDCDTYAHSGFYRICKLYKSVVGSRTIPSNTYQMYVREKTTDEGFFKYGTDYIKLLEDQILTASEGNAKCKELYGGQLIRVKDQAMNDLITNRILMLRAIPQAFIGITDKDSEGTWTYEDGTGVTYTNWNWNGIWNRKDLNCAVMLVNGFWRHRNCDNKYYIICQIPMF